MEMQVSGYPAGLNSDQVAPDPWTRQESIRYYISTHRVNREPPLLVFSTDLMLSEL